MALAPHCHKYIQTCMYTNVFSHTQALYIHYYPYTLACTATHGSMCNLLAVCYTHSVLSIHMRDIVAIHTPLSIHTLACTATHGPMCNHTSCVIHMRDIVSYTYNTIYTYTTTYTYTSALVHSHTRQHMDPCVTILVVLYTTTSMSSALRIQK